MHRNFIDLIMKEVYGIVMEWIMFFNSEERNPDSYRER